MVNFLIPPSIHSLIMYFSTQNFTILTPFGYDKEQSLSLSLSLSHTHTLEGEMVWDLWASLIIH